MCGQVAVIRRGKLIAVGSPNELRARRGEPHVEVVGTGFGDSLLATLKTRPEVVSVEVANDRLLILLRGKVGAAPIVKMMVEQGAQVEEVRKGKASLEDVFLSLMADEDAPAR